MSTPSYGAACGYSFKEGQEYLVYAYFGNGEDPKDGGEALTDTSGGVPVRVMVGLAGLAMAASLLVLVRLVRTD